MALPLMAIPIAMGAAGTAGALGQYGAARAQADALMPDEYRKRLAELEARERAGTLGLSEGDRQSMEMQGVAQRAGQTAQTQARQLQQASAASGAALTGRDLFAQEMGLQDRLATQRDAEARRIREADERAEAQQRQTMMELQQRQADAEAARKMANRQLMGDLATVGLTAGASAYGASQMQAGMEGMMAATAGTEAARQAQMQAVQGQMMMGMAGSFAGPRIAPPAPMAAPAPVRPPAPAGGMFPATNPMMSPFTANPYGPRVVGYQQMPDGSMVPVYAQGGF